MLNQNKKILEKIIPFLHLSEKLKCELRHSWTSTNRQESVSDHSWRLSLMILILYPHINRNVDVSKCLIFSIIHDLSEVIIGDKHHLEINKTSESKEKRKHLENLAMSSLLKKIDNTDLHKNWIEFQEQKTFEAQLIYFLDKLEVCIQHNETDITNWTEEEIASINQYYDALHINNEFLLDLKELVKQETLNKIKSLI